MKKCSLVFLLLVLCTLIQAQDFEVETFSRSGDDDKRINLVFLSDGYQEHESNKFRDDVRLILLEIFLTTPFKEYKNYFNVHLIKVPSNVVEPPGALITLLTITLEVPISMRV